MNGIFAFFAVSFIIVLVIWVNVAQSHMQKVEARLDVIESKLSIQAQ